MESPRHPVAGVDYPRTFHELDAWFGSETACREYIRRLRWPDGFVCPHCAAVGEPLGNVAQPVALPSLRSAGIADGRNGAAGHAQAAADGAMWFVTSQKNGVSALGLQRVLGLGSYETAWTWLHKLRRAMVRP